MNNYQLYRTNVLLGGQMKYDLILSQNSNNHNIDIKDIHITPISSNAPYNKYIDDDVLNYNHIENIKTFYKKTSGSFYKTFINPALNNLYPLPDEYNKESKETTYEMGCRRKSNQLYDKQFEFLCPVWLEQISEFEDLSFEIQIKTSPTAQNIITKKIVFEGKLAKYFDDYTKLLGLYDGYDWVFNISKQNCIVSGVDVKNGTCKELRLSNFYNDLLYRERPLLEVNNLIINELNKHNLITRQLFNFNLCFNISDILGFYTFNQLKDYPLYINVVVCINDKPLDLRDIFSNHEYIDKPISEIPTLSINNGEISISEERSGINVLDYLNDNKHIDLVDKNKILQNTCHWEYSNIKGSIFNLYDGFCGVFKAIDNTEATPQQFKYYNSKYYNGFSTDLNMTNINEIGYPYWCNAYKVQNLYEILCDMIDDTSRYQNLFSTFSQNCVVNNINYHVPTEDMHNIDVVMLQTDFDLISEDDLLQLNTKITEMHVNGVRKWHAYPDQNITTIKNYGYGILCSDIESDINIKRERKIIILVDINNDKLNNFLYRNLMNLYASTSTETDKTNTFFGSDLFKDLCEYLSTANRSGFEIVQFSNRLTKKLANSPSISSKEIEYFKINTPHINKSAITRSFGKIKPYFIKNNEVYKNYTYSKMKYKELELQPQAMYKIYSRTLYEPRFPSIEYFAFKCEDTNYDDLGKIDTNVAEFHNYTINKILHLEPILEKIFTSSQDDNNAEENLINQCIKDKYKVLLSSITGEKYYEYFNYIKSKYILNHSSIESIDSVNNSYNYKIQLKLK